MMPDSKSFIFSVFKLTGLLSYFIHAGLTYGIDKNHHSHIKLKTICTQKYMSKHFQKKKNPAKLYMQTCIHSLKQII